VYHTPSHSLKEKFKVRQLRAVDVPQLRSGSTPARLLRLVRAQLVELELVALQGPAIKQRLELRQLSPLQRDLPRLAPIRQPRHALSSLFVLAAVRGLLHLPGERNAG